MKRVFVCCPYRGDIDANVALAKKIGYYVTLMDYAPIIPQLMYPAILDEKDPKTRVKALTMDAALLECVDEIWIIGSVYSSGMKYLITKAIELQIPVRLYDTDLDRVMPETMEIDDRVTGEMMEVLKGAKYA